MSSSRRSKIRLAFGCEGDRLHRSLYCAVTRTRFPNPSCNTHNSRRHHAARSRWGRRFLEAGHANRPKEKVLSLMRPHERPGHVRCVRKVSRARSSCDSEPLPAFTFIPCQMRGSPCWCPTIGGSFATVRAGTGRQVATGMPMAPAALPIEAADALPQRRPAAINELASPRTARAR